MDAPQFSALMQACVSPMLLISGVGLILLTAGNRLSHTIERTRHLAAGMDVAADKAGRREQIRILFWRARVLQCAIACVVCSILSSSLIVFSLFWAHFRGVPLQPLATGLFALSLLFLIAAVSLLLVDVSRALAALRLELGDKLSPPVDKAGRSR
jgi:hypothetical protein